MAGSQAIRRVCVCVCVNMLYGVLAIFFFTKIRVDINRNKLSNHYNERELAINGLIQTKMNSKISGGQK